MDVRTFRTAGLGDTTYLLVHDGLGVLVDPQRDVERFLAAAEDAGVKVRWVLETHVHNDYVSGAREAAALTGAELVVPAGAAVPFGHVPAFHGDDLDSGALRIRPLHTPGHTPEHVSYLVLVEGEPSAVFSGGALLVGSAGRSDLLGRERAEGLARAQYRSVRRLAALPGDVGLYPTHGQGSFCTVASAGPSTSTVARERAENPVLAYPDEDSYVRGELSALVPYPRYYAHMGPINQRGPTPLPATGVRRLSLEEFDAARGPGGEVAVVDARDREAFAAGHVEGALGIELSDEFGVWVGWLVPFGTPVVLVVDGDTDVNEAVVQLGRIGFDEVVGTLSMDDWRAACRALRTYARASVDRFASKVREALPQVLDVRSPAEFEESHVPGAVHTYVPDLVDSPPTDLEPDEPVWVLCTSGFRSTIAAGLLEIHGFTPVVLDRDGTPEVLEALEAASTPSGSSRTS